MLLRLLPGGKLSTNGSTILRALALLLLSLINAFLVVALIAILADVADAKPSDVSKKQEEFDISIVGMIQETRGNIFTIPPEGAVMMGKIIEEYNAAMKAHPERVTIFINSPGGEVGNAGMMFMKAMERDGKGMTIRCVVGDMAGSLAMAIFSRCTERVVRPTSKLMWHSARIVLQGQTQLDEGKAKQVVEYIAGMNSILWAPLKSILDDSEGFQSSCDQEYVWPAAQAVRAYPQLAKIEPAPSP